MNIKVKYFNTIYSKQPLRYTGDWVDVRACAGVKILNSERKWEPANHMPYGDYCTVQLHKGDLVKIPLGFAMELPAGYEAILEVRSSTSKNTGLIKATSGVIDEGYCGDDDQWFFIGYATRDELLYLNERIAQFRIQKKQPPLEFETVEKLGNKDRGGHGSTGRF